MIFGELSHLKEKSRNLFPNYVDISIAKQALIHSNQRTFENYQHNK